MEVVAMMTWTSVICVAYFVLKVGYETISCYWLTPRRIRKIMETQGVRGPKPRFLVGNTLDMASLVGESSAADEHSIHHDLVPRLLPHYLLWSKTYGKRFIYWNGVEPRMCLTETELIRDILSKHNPIMGKSWQQQQGTKHFVGGGLLMANGDDWTQQRHTAAPAFMGDRLKRYAGCMVKCGQECVQSLENAMEKGQNEFEIGEYMTRLTANVISRTQFDPNYEKGMQISQLLALLQHLSAKSAHHLFFPGSRLLPSRYNREIKSLKKEVQGLLMDIIQSRKDCVEIGRSSSYGDDLLGLLLNEMQKKRYARLNLELIIDELKSFFFAGHETTSLLLTWTLMLLASNPSWQDKLRAEVQSVCHDHSPPSLEHLPKLTLLNMVINETLRLYPPASILPRTALEDIKLGDLYIPKGLSIWIPVLAIHRDEQIWGKDVNDFNPERFGSKSFKPGRLYLPFAAGPRNCPGQAFALMEAKIILAMLLSKFTFAISQNYRHAPQVVLTMKPKYGVQLILKPFNN